MEEMISSFITDRKDIEDCGEDQKSKAGAMSCDSADRRGEILADLGKELV